MQPTQEPPTRPFTSFVPEESNLPELTFRAVFLGTVMAIVLGTANAYLGMKAGLTVAATFPAAVVAMAALRIFGGSVLEENMARTTASVGGMSRSCVNVRSNSMRAMVHSSAYPTPAP